MARTFIGIKFRVFSSVFSLYKNDDSLSSSIVCGGVTSLTITLSQRERGHYFASLPEEDNVYLTSVLRP